ncbi:hypothetical protein [Parashewanella tropica]|uniref:hypothetical protein n=1 Tax=Parashewanella tropica TaxID=2547970 RepID=UPI001059B5E8|nr:hypothetical protein [Parashewanella tropica]
MLLQLFVVNVGAHQIHETEHQIEGDSHAHLQLEVTKTVANDQCNIGDWEQSLNQEQHQHSKVIDLCLDCQCHATYVTLFPPFQADKSITRTIDTTMVSISYFPPDIAPAYRPPILPQQV